MHPAQPSHENVCVFFAMNFTSWLSIYSKLYIYIYQLSMFNGWILENS